MLIPTLYRSFIKISHKNVINNNTNNGQKYIKISKKSATSKEIKEQLKWPINGIDIVGCELAQNIAKKLQEK